MEPPHTVYNQAGPSNPNYTVPYAQEGRPPSHYGSGRGRGHPSHRYANSNYHQAQQQPFFTPGVPNSYAGYSLGMNGPNSTPISGQYSQAQNGLPRRPGPSYHSGSFQVPSSPALHPVHLYNPHPTPYIPSTPASGPTPMYPYPHSPAHLQPYPAAFSPPFHHPSPPFSNHQNAKSPLLSPPIDNSVNLSRTWKVQQPPSPRPLQAPLPSQRKGAPSSPHPPSSPSPPPPPPPAVNGPLPHPESQTSSPKQPLPVTETQPSPPSNSPPSSTITLPSFDNESAPLPEWVISASRPNNPAIAPGIMISPKAKPPSHIVKGAQEYIPPVRSKVPLIDSVSFNRPKTQERGSADSGPESFADAVPSQVEHASCSTTETERTSTVPDAFVAGSPLSTATSVSIAGPKADSPSPKESQSSPVLESPEATTISESPKPTVSASVASSVTGDSPGPSSSTKKSWASLLRSEASSPSKTKLPISSVQGFSIPAQSAAGPSSTPASSGSRGKHADLLRLLDNGPGGSIGVPQIRPRGLVNTGNMCFANAILQTLVYTPPFFHLFTELRNFKGTGPDPSKWADKDTPLVNAIVEFLKEFDPAVKNKSKDSYEDDDDNFAPIDSFIPSYVYDAMKEKSRFDNMGGGQQEDAEEFFGFFLDTIEEELLAISKALKEVTRSKGSAQERNSIEADVWMEVGKKNRPVTARTTKTADSPMARIFGGKFRSTLKVPGQRDSVVVEDWRSLKLDIQREHVESIEDALRYISHPQPVQVSSVTKGGAVVEATQQILVDALPPILVLHLKRFLYDTTARDVIKVHKQVSYGPELEIPTDAITPVRRTSRPAKYKLFAVLYHHGSSAAGGHYSLDVLHPHRNAKPEEGWIRIDDESVIDLGREQVFGNERDSAYLLFYRRMGSRVI